METITVRHRWNTSGSNQTQRKEVKESEEIKRCKMTKTPKWCVSEMFYPPAFNFLKFDKFKLQWKDKRLFKKEYFQPTSGKTATEVLLMLRGDFVTPVCNRLTFNNQVLLYAALESIFLKSPYLIAAIFQTMSRIFPKKCITKKCRII